MVAVSSEQAAAIRGAARQELARRQLLDFSALCVDGFRSAHHLEHLAGLLEGVERGEIRKLIMTLHPGAGKSTLLQSFAAWYLGRDPRRKIIAASAGSELSERNSRATRALLEGETWPFDSELSQDTRSMTRWSTTKGGGLFAIGVGGLITGWRANLIICDDLQNSAGSATERDGLWQWFREVLTPRLEPGGAIMLIGTRWGEDDLPGRIAEAADGEEWRVVRLPALAEANDALDRPVGQPLWPERWSADELLRQKVAMGSRAFETQYQGNPVPAEGNLIKAQWLQRYDKPPAEFTKVVCALDAAAKTGVRNDYSAIVKIGVTRDAYYVIDAWRDKVEFPGLLRRVKLLESESPAPSAIYVEDTSNATALIQQLKAESRLPIVPVSAKGSKESRVEGITGTLEAKRVFFPNEAPWLVEFERELLAFPAGKHDDQVDAFTLALSQLVGRSSSWSFSIGDGDNILTIDGVDEVVRPDNPPEHYGSAVGAVAAVLRGS